MIPSKFLASSLCWVFLATLLPGAVIASPLMADGDDIEQKILSKIYNLWPDSNSTQEASTAMNSNTYRKRKTCGSGGELAPEIPRFLFAGQSNMEGQSNDVLKGLFQDTVRIVNKKFKEPMPTKKSQIRKRRDRIVNALTSKINEAEVADPLASKNEAKILYKMAGGNKKRSVLSDEIILQPHPKVVCSFSDPEALSMDIDCEKPVTGKACGLRTPARGRQYGPELMFAHHFSKLNTQYKKQAFGITKVAKGGTTIAMWLKNTETKGSLWPSLEANIHADRGTIEAFVWYQGENDHFPATSQKDYFNRLTQFVADVRQEIFDAHKERWGDDGSPTANFTTPADVPVVICELASWIGNGVSSHEPGGTPGNVIRAQREFVAGDNNSILVNTGTDVDPEKRLSKYYHLDAPTILIIGHRIAEALQQLMRPKTDILF